MARHIKGARRLPSGNWQAFGRYGAENPGGGRKVVMSPVFEDTLPDLVDRVRQWHKDRQADVENATPAAHSISADIVAYGRRLKDTQTSKTQILKQLDKWAAKFGRDRLTSSITRHEVEQATVERQRDEGLSDGTTRRYVGMLSGFMSSLYGKGNHAVSGATRPDEPELESFSVTFDVVEKILAHMTDRITSPDADGVRRLAFTKIRARVMAYTGIPPAVIKTLRDEDLHLDDPHPWVNVRVRRKTGMIPEPLPLTPEGTNALRIFRRENAFGYFNPHNVNRAVKAAIRKANLSPDISLYWLRHSFGAHMYRVTKDRDTVGRFMLHKPGSKWTSRYTKGAHLDVDRVAVAAFSTSLQDIRKRALNVVPKPAAACNKTAKMLHEMLHAPRKSSVSR